MRTRWLRYLAIAAAPTLFLAACPAEEAEVAEPEEPADEAVAEEAEDPGDGPPMFTDPSISDLDIVFERDRFTILLHTLPAQDRLWSDTFDNVNVVYSDDPVAPLVGGAAWIVQAEPGIMWPALEQGIVDGVITGITDDKEFWYLMCREGIDEPEDMIGQRITGGTVGDTWITIGRIILRDEFGMDPDDMEWVSVGGGSDGRMEAMLAGEVDCFMGQPRNLPPTEEAGGSALFAERVENAQLQFVVQRETWENNRDAVCAAMEGHLEAVLWVTDYEESEGVDKIPEMEELYERYGYDPAEVEDNWVSSYPFVTSRDMGATVEALDQQQEIHKGADDPAISQDFDWRDYADFSCLWELQEAYGLAPNPDPDEL
jgi:hypothetical protein